MTDPWEYHWAFCTLNEEKLVIRIDAKGCIVKITFWRQVSVNQHIIITAGFDSNIRT